jgi:VIT1/CCC1 family predicted Fe2+/Mn2+ transporter
MKNMTEKTLLQQHLEDEHQQTMLSEHIKELVYGGIDGIITTFAVVAGFTGATAMMGDDGALTIPVTIVLIFGLANLFADGFSMGVGDFLSSRAEKKLFEKEQKKERGEIKNNISFELYETVEILKDHGFSKEDAEQLAEIYSHNTKFWVDFMMRYELDMSQPSQSPARGALITFTSFIFFGAIPLLPYMFDIPSFDGQFFMASLFAAIALAILGFVRARFTRENVMRSMTEIVGLGMIAAFIAYFVGTFFA